MSVDGGSTLRSGERLDRLAMLEEERRFLLGSLRDLEREHDAGDVDDVDYATLRDGYTVRAASVLRQIDAGRRDLAPRRPRQWGRTIVVGVASTLIAVGIGFALASAFGERGTNDEITGATPGDTVRTVLANGRAAMGAGDFAGANALFVEADQLELERGNDNPEARTYVGWTFALLARSEPESELTVERYELALFTLGQAIEMDPTFADPYCFSAIIEYQFLGDADAALPFVETCEASNPPADMQGLISGFAQEIRDAAS